MKPMMSAKPLSRVLLLLPTIIGLIAFDSRSVASAQFLEDYGHAGTLRTLKGQVRYSDDTPIPHATLRITNLGNGKDYVIEASEGGNFIKADLPSGKYKINVSGTGSNIGEFTVRISQGSPTTSSKYIIVKLSPGCASGDSGLKLVSKIKKQ
jgi:hypothetical protein